MECIDLNQERSKDFCVRFEPGAFMGYFELNQERSNGELD